MKMLKDLSNQDLVSHTVSTLREFIVDEFLVSGAELPSQGELAKQLGVSRTVIREAMRILESQGLIEVRHGCLPRVMPPNSRMVIEGLNTLVARSAVNLFDVQEVRRLIEVAAAVSAAELATEECFAQMREANEAMENASTIETQILADMKFHRLIADATGNPVFGIVLDALSQFLFESRRKTLSQTGPEVALRHHRRLLAALESRDVTAAREAAEDGMRQTLADLRREAREEAEGADGG